MENTTQNKKPLVAAATLTIVISNLLSLITTALGLKQSYFQADTLLNICFVVGISGVIQLTKASLDRVEKRNLLLLIYIISLVLSSSFSAISFINAAYPPEHFAEVARSTLSSSYADNLLNIQSDIGNDMSAARDTLWDSLEGIQSALQVEQVQQTALSGLSSAMLDKYTVSNAWNPGQDNYYLALESVLEHIEAEELDTAKQEAEAAYAQLASEDRTDDGSGDVDTLRRQLNALRSTLKEQRESLEVQLTEAIKQQQILKTRYYNHTLLQNDFETVLRAFGLADSGDAKAASAIDQLEHELLLKEQTPETIRTLIDDVVNNADSAEMDLRSVAQLHAEAETYLDLLSSNTALLREIAALETLPAKEATAESWREFWSEKVGTLKQLTAVSSLSDSKKKEDYIHTLDNLLRRYTVEHSNPLEYAFICTISRSNGLALLCIAIAFLLDLAGFAAFKVVKCAA